MKNFFLIIAVMLITFPAHANPARLKEITTVFETFEAGFSYLKHCGDFKKNLSENPFYMANASLTAVALAKEIVFENPEATLDQAQKMVFKRRNDIQAYFDKVYQINSCESEQANAAKKAIDLFSQTPPEKMMNHLDEIEKH